MVWLHVTSGDVKVWRHDVTWRHIMNLCVSLDPEQKKEDFWAKDCTIWETQEVHERSGIFIETENVILCGDHVPEPASMLYVIFNNILFLYF